MAKRGFLDGYKTYDTSNGYGDPGKWRSAFRSRMNADEAKAILARTSESPHSILGVATNATVSQIKSAYYTKMKEWHPDRNQHRISDAEEMAKKLSAAYATLNPKQKNTSKSHSL
jgi:DnaJ-class molecular chaperone